MLLHRYLEETLGSKVAIRLLRTMVRYRGMIFTIRRLAGETNVSPNEAALITHQLEKLGVIRIQPVGRAYQLQLNEESYILNKIIKPILDAEKNTISELVQILKKHLDNKKIISAVLFGSVSKGEEKIDSDTDLLIISDDFDNAILSASKAGEEVFEVFHGKISQIIFSEKQFKSKKNNDLIRSIIANHILICGKELASIK
ncbi:MAG: nucleotidyltransferase domain-containing protein [Thaumarchaeota archaeon]|nr:nucleotidyltransferase domain-containing protein [Nitrososphaerota archaeon]